MDVSKKGDFGLRVGLLTQSAELLSRLHSIGIAHAWTIQSAPTPLGLLNCADSGTIDLALLHWTMCGFEGIYCCAVLKSQAKSAALPIVILSDRIEAKDYEKALEAGADDVVATPCSDRSLIARLKLTLAPRKPGKIGRFLLFNNIVMDADKNKVFHKGFPVHLRAVEFNLLRTFLENPYTVLSKEYLVQRVCRSSIEIDPACITVYVKRLRLALFQAGSDNLIRSVRGKGYTLDDEGCASPSVGASALLNA